MPTRTALSLATALAAVLVGTAGAAAASSQPAGLVTIAFGGDVHFESPIRERLATSPASVLAPVAPLLRAADLAVVNLETAVTDRPRQLAAQAKQYAFHAPSRAFQALSAGGVDVASMANNHGMDYGVGGLRDSLAAAKRARFPVIGVGLDEARAYAPYTATVNGRRIAIIGATQVLDDHLIPAWTAGPAKPGLASAKRVARLVRAVEEARAEADTVVVHLHWGEELNPCPLPRQKDLARRLAAAGADVIVGGHAHIPLGAGRLGKAFVAYGLGNFVFYASRESARQTGVLTVTMDGRKVVRYAWAPARITDGRPHPLSGSGRAQALRDWNALRPCTGLKP